MAGEAAKSNEAVNTGPKVSKPPAAKGVRGPGLTQPDHDLPEIDRTWNRGRGFAPSEIVSVRRFGFLRPNGFPLYIKLGQRGREPHRCCVDRKMRPIDAT